MTAPPIILASTSRIREKLLRNAGVTFTSTAPAVDEAKLKKDNPELDASRLALLLAEAKATAVSVMNPEAIVIGADQVLADGPRIYDKPKSIVEARHQLTMLRGKSHKLVSAVSCADHGGILWSHADEARMTMRMFSDEFLDTYVRECGNDVVASVGAYKLEERGIQLFESIAGDYFTILGLPLLPLLDFLRRQDALPA